MISLAKIIDAAFWWRRRSSSKLTDFFSLASIRAYLVINFFLNVLIWLGATYIYHNLYQNLTVLHYNVDFGIDLIGDRNQVFTIPALGLLLFILNLLLLFFFIRSRHFKFIAHLLLGVLVVTQIFLLLSLQAVYLINFR